MPVAADAVTEAPKRRRIRSLRQIPEPGRFWIAAGPRAWPCTEGPWTDLANGRLGAYQGPPESIFPAVEAGKPDDLFYLPTVDPSLAVGRDRLAAELVEAGTPVLVELSPGETAPPGRRGSLPSSVR